VVSSKSCCYGFHCIYREGFMGSRDTYIYSSSAAGSTNNEQLGRVKPFSRKFNVDIRCFMTKGDNRSSIIDYLTHSSPHRAAVAYAYCDYRLQDSQTTICLVACFLRQLLEVFWEVNTMVYSSPYEMIVDMALIYSYLFTYQTLRFANHLANYLR
jgi:hypothetical protein